jgi:hypothetical protein
MKGMQYVIARQSEWAKNRDIELIGSKGGRGRPTYTTTLDKNLFQSLANHGIGPQILRF